MIRSVENGLEQRICRRILLFDRRRKKVAMDANLLLETEDRCAEDLDLCCTSPKFERNSRAEPSTERARSLSVDQPLHITPEITRGVAEKQKERVGVVHLP